MLGNNYTTLHFFGRSSYRLRHALLQSLFGDDAEFHSQGGGGEEIRRHNPGNRTAHIVLPTTLEDGDTNPAMQ